MYLSTDDGDITLVEEILEVFPGVISAQHHESLLHPLALHGRLPPQLLDAVRPLAALAGVLGLRSPRHFV